MNWLNYRDYIAVQIFVAATAWLSGYDFDHRSAEVSFWFATSVVCGVIFAGMCESFRREE